MNNKKLRTIQFSKLLNRTIQKDNDFKESFFSDVYSQANDLIYTIIEENDRKAKQNNYSKSFFSIQPVTDVNNVIAFTGRRGTGKTSAMLTFADALVCGAWNKDDTKYSNIRFYSIPYINASMADIKNEDLFEIIISKMLKVIEDISNKYGMLLNEALHVIDEKFARLHSHYVSLNRDDETDFLPSYSIMKKKMEKHDIHNEMIEFVRCYTNIIRQATMENEFKGFFPTVSNSCENYLVICIDDIDMAQKNHIDIMQLIYQYFMIPGVIVMITLNTPILNSSVKKEFFSKLDINYQAEKDYVLSLSNNQTSDFLRKIIPSDMRITMPSWKKMDLRDLSPICVEFDDKLEDYKVKGFGKLSDDFINNLKIILKDRSNSMFVANKLTPKELIMILLADRTHCYLDCMGHKFHFMEPDSIRNLFDLFYLLYNLKDAKENDKTNFDNLEYNRKILLNYIYFRMIPEFNMPPDAREHIENISIDVIDRRGRDIWEYYYQKFMKKETEIKALYSEEFVRQEKEKHKIKNYNFGEVFRCLYFGARLNLFDKNYVKAVLATYSFTLPQYVEMQKKARLCHHQDKRGQIDNFDSLTKDKKFELLSKIRNGEHNYMFRFRELKDVFGYSFLGQWRKDLFDDRTVLIVINKEIFSNNLNTNREETIRHLILLLSLSSLSTREFFKVEEAEYTWRINADLEPTAFIMGNVRIARIFTMNFLYKDEVYSLWELITKFCDNEDDNNFKNNIYSDVFDIVIDMYGKDRFKGEKCDQPQNDIIWFLLKNTDITYNIIKRTIKQFLYTSDGNLNRYTNEILNNQTPFEIFRSFYEKMNYELEKEDKLYHFINERDGIKYNLKSNDVVSWFINSKFYGKYTCILEAEKCITADEENLKKCFYYYGCGLEFNDVSPSPTLRNIFSLYSANGVDLSDLLRLFDPKYLDFPLSQNLENKYHTIISEYVHNNPASQLTYKITKVRNEMIKNFDATIKKPLSDILKKGLDATDCELMLEHLTKCYIDINTEDFETIEILKYIRNEAPVDVIVDTIKKYKKKNNKKRKKLSIKDVKKNVSTDSSTEKNESNEIENSSLKTKKNSAGEES